MRLSVTDLETLRYHKAREDADLDGLLLSLAHVEPPNRKMQAGRAMAKFFEHTKSGNMDSFESEGWKFFLNFDGYFAVPLVRELKLEHEFQTPSGPVTLVGMVDSLTGITVRDQKLTDTFDFEAKYIDSMQWRAYLVMTGAQKFYYDIFVGKLSEHDNSVSIREYHEVALWRYPGIESDVERAVCELADVVIRYGREIRNLKETQHAGSM